jgi:hypothetical protein
MTPDVIRRVQRKIQQTQYGCWIYTGKWHDGKGYKKVWVNGTGCFVHRVMFEWFWRRRLRAGVQLDHVCCNRACCNPLHLKAMMNKKNSQLRSKRAKKRAVPPVNYNQLALDAAEKLGIAA